MIWNSRIPSNNHFSAWLSHATRVKYHMSAEALFIIVLSCLNKAGRKKMTQQAPLSEWKPNTLTERWSQQCYTFWVWKVLKLGALLSAPTCSHAVEQLPWWCVGLGMSFEAHSLWISDTKRSPIVHAQYRTWTLITTVCIILQLWNWGLLCDYRSQQRLNAFMM